MKYDDSDPIDIERYGRGMIGLSFREMFEWAVVEGNPLVEDKKYMAIHADRNFKGGMGNLVEECWFGYKANSNPEPDFEKAGVELKVTPYKAVKKGFSAKERLVLTMIDYMEVYKEKDLLSSHLWKKLGCILLAWYLHKDGQNDIDSTVDFVQLFTPPAEDLEIIKSDYRKIIAKVEAGKAQELSEGDTLYLGACTKAATSKDRREQPFSDTPAKPRAFSLKNSYMTYLLNHYIMPGKVTYEPICKTQETAANLETYVMARLHEYQGMSVEELCDRFELVTRPKDITSMLAFRILGVKGNQCEEFEKAGIAVKTIRISKNGKIRENMSFPTFRFAELAQEEWEDSTFGNYLRETRFFFIIYRETDAGEWVLQGGQFWNMPVEDIEGDVKAVWQETHDIIKGGQLTLSLNATGNIVNNLPKKKDHKISHVRPHGQNKLDTYPLPAGTHLTLYGNASEKWEDDTRYTKQCFWLNNDYILEQIKQ